METPFSLAHRAKTAFRALLLLASGESDSARACPPREAPAVRKAYMVVELKFAPDFPFVEIEGRIYVVYPDGILVPQE